MTNEKRDIDMTTTNARDKALRYMIRRIITDPNVHYYCGYGTEACRLLTLAVAEMEGLQHAEVEAELRAACKGIPEAEVAMLRRQIRNMEG